MKFNNVKKYAVSLAIIFLMLSGVFAAIPLSFARPLHIYFQDSGNASSDWQLRDGYGNVFNQSTVSNGIVESSLQIWNLSLTLETSAIFQNITGLSESTSIVFGFWLRALDFDANTQFNIRLFDEVTGDYMCIQLIGSTGLAWKSAKGSGGTYSGYSWDIDWTEGDTYWIEIGNKMSGDDVSWYANGTGYGGCSGYNVRLGNTTTTCTLRVSGNLNVGKILLDTIRVASEYEYPPTGTSLTVHSTDNNLILPADSGQIIINNTAYDCGTISDIPPGNYNVSFYVPVNATWVQWVSDVGSNSFADEFSNETVFTAGDTDGNTITATYESALPTLTVNTSPEISAPFTMNGTSYTTPEGFDGYNTYTLEMPTYVSCKWIFADWLLNDTTYTTDNPLTLVIDGNSIATAEYDINNVSYSIGETTVNIDGDFSQSTHDTYWNPHNVSNINSWSITYPTPIYGGWLNGIDYGTLTLDTISTDSGHIAAGTWWSTWNLSTVARQPLNGTTWLVDADIRISEATYAGASPWLRIAIASAFCDPDNDPDVGTDGVKYTEMDIYDNPAATSHEFGDAIDNGNVIFQGNDVVEWRYDSLSTGVWRHYSFNLTKYIEAAWGNISTIGRLESVYFVIEVEQETHVTLDFKNFWLRAINSSDPYFTNSGWENVASKITGEDGSSRWTTVMQNSTGYTLFADLYNPSYNNTMTSIWNDDGVTFWITVYSSPNYVTESNNDTDFMNGTDSYQIIADKSAAANCYIKHLYTEDQDWNYDFLCFYIQFSNETGSSPPLEYLHRFQIYDNDSNVYEWEIKDYNVTVKNYTGKYNSSWVKVVLPLNRPTIGTTINFSAIREIRFLPNYANEAKEEQYGFYSTIKLDCFYLDNGTDAYYTFNVPMTWTNITLMAKHENTGYMGKYVSFASNSSGVVNTTLLEFLRPRFDATWAPIGIYNITTGANNGVSWYEYGFAGDTVSVMFGEPSGDKVVAGLAMATKLTLRLRLPPNDGLQLNWGQWEQEYAFGSISELKFAMYVETTDKTFVDYRISDLSCVDWIITEYQIYHANANITADPAASIDFSMFNYTDVQGSLSSFYYSNYTQYGTTLDHTYVEAGNLSIASTSFVNYYGTVYESVPFFPKKFTIDTYAVDFYFGLNTSLTPSLTWGQRTAYFNIYSQGGLERMIVSNSTLAGRYDGGDAWNLYSINQSYAYSEMYYRNLVHFKTCLTFQAAIGTFGANWWGRPIKDIAWEGSLLFKFGVDHYSNTQEIWLVGGTEVWIELIQLHSSVTERYAKFWVLVYGKTPYGSTLLTNNTVYCYYNDQDTTATLWLDFWYNRLNASSVYGSRVGSYYYAMETTSPWYLIYINGGSWGASRANETVCMTFGNLCDGSKTIPSTDIIMERFWCRLDNTIYAMSGEGSEGMDSVKIGIPMIKVFDLTFGADMTGIQTPTFMEPMTPDMPTGGLFGMLSSFVAQLIAVLTPAMSYIWSGLVWIFDEALFFITGQRGLFSSFISFATSAAAFVVQFALIFVANATNILTVIVSSFTWFFTNIFTWVWGVIQFVVLNPVFNIFSVIASIFGIAYAWLVGTSWTNPAGQVFDFSYLYGFNLMGIHGGLAFITIIFICVFFMLFGLCVVQLSFEPLLEPIRMFWGFVMFIQTVMDTIVNLIFRVISLLANVINTLRNLAPKIFGTG